MLVDSAYHRIEQQRTRGYQTPAHSTVWFPPRPACTWLLLATTDLCIAFAAGHMSCPGPLLSCSAPWSPRWTVISLGWQLLTPTSMAGGCTGLAPTCRMRTWKVGMRNTLFTSPHMAATRCLTPLGSSALLHRLCSELPASQGHVQAAARPGAGEDKQGTDHQHPSNWPHNMYQCSILVRKGHSPTADTSELTGRLGMQGPQHAGVQPC